MTYVPSNAKLAELAGISASYASQIRRGVKSPPLSTALKIWRLTSIAYGPLASMTAVQIAQVDKAFQA